MIDTSSVKHTSLGGRKYWLLTVDDCTDFCWSFFLKSKDELSDKIIELIKELKNGPEKITVEKIRCDGAGENKDLEGKAKKDGLGLIFEITARNTPQHNGRVERKFQTLYNRVCAMLNAARLTQSMRNNLWAERTRTTTSQQNV